MIVALATAVVLVPFCRLAAVVVRPAVADYLAGGNPAGCRPAVVDCLGCGRPAAVGCFDFSGRCLAGGRFASAGRPVVGRFAVVVRPAAGCFDFVCCLAAVGCFDFVGYFAVGFAVAVSGARFPLRVF